MSTTIEITLDPTTQAGLTIDCELFLAGALGTTIEGLSEPEPGYYTAYTPALDAGFYKARFVDRASGAMVAEGDGLWDGAEWTRNTGGEIALEPVMDRFDDLQVELNNLKTQLLTHAPVTVISGTQLTRDEHLRLRQGMTYSIASGTAVVVQVEGGGDDVLTDGTEAWLRLKPRPGYKGEALNIAGLLTEEDGEIHVIVELSAAQTSALPAAFRGYRWELDLFLQGDPENAVTPIAGLCTVEKQVA